MKMRRIAETGALGRLESYYKQRHTALANVLQQKLDYFNPQNIGGAPGEQEALGLDPSGFEGIGSFVVEPVPSQDPSKSLAYVRDESGVEMLVDTVIAASLLDQLQAGATSEEVWDVLSEASAESDTGAMSFASEDERAQNLWDQQFVASRRSPFVR